MYTLGQTTTRKVILSEDGLLAMGFTAKAEVKLGAAVKIDSDGEVLHCAAVTDFPIGIVEVAAAIDEVATIRTHFSQIQKAKADGAVAIGDRLACSGYDSTDELPDMKVSVSTNFVVAIALTAGADNAEITVGILRSPYLHTINT